MFTFSFGTALAATPKYTDKDVYLADVAAPTKYFSKEGCHVYFALKKDGQPVNPMTKLKAQ